MIVALGPFKRWKAMKPGTPSRWLSRFSQTCSKSASAPLRTLKRFMAMNIVSFLPCSRQNSEEMPSFQAILAIRFSMPVSDT